MKYLRRVHPLSWFLLVLFGLVICLLTYMVLAQFLSLEPALTATILMLFHVGIYWVMLNVNLKRGLYWLSLFIQLGLILLLIQKLDFLPVSVTLLPLLLIIVTIMLQRARASLVVLGGSLAFLLQQERRSHEQTKDLLQQLNIAHAQLSAYALRVEELTAITERQRIARDLHDTLVQGVVGLLMQLDVVATQLEQEKTEKARKLLVQVLDTGRDILSDARYAIGELRTTRLRPDDLIEVVQEEVNRFSTKMGVYCVCEIASLVETPDMLCEHVLRVITEGLANIARHAHAHTVWIQATQCDDVLTIEVRDDGVGFDTSLAHTQVGHYGLLGMRERARMIGGEFHVRSTIGEGEGTVVQLRIPVHPVGHREGEHAWPRSFGSSLSMTM